MNATTDYKPGCRTPEARAAVFAAAEKAGRFDRAKNGAGFYAAHHLEVEDREDALQDAALAVCEDAVSERPRAVGDSRIGQDAAADTNRGRWHRAKNPLAPATYVHVETAETADLEAAAEALGLRPCQPDEIVSRREDRGAFIRGLRGLESREIIIAFLLVVGEGRKEIADRLGLSKGRVTQIVDIIEDKMHDVFAGPLRQRFRRDEANWLLAAWMISLFAAARLAEEAA